MDHDWDAEETTPDMLSRQCLARVAGLRVAVVGGGLGGLMAARELARLGAQVTVYEARAQVGGRVLSDSTFAKGRITEIGAELVGSIHTHWCKLAKEYGISLISRMDAELYRGQQLEERVILDRPLTAKEIADIKGQEIEPLLHRIADFAEKTIPAGRESQPWKENGLLPLDHTSVAHALETQFQVVRNSEQWRTLELLLVNDNVAQLDQMNFLGLLCLVRGGQVERATIAPNSLMGYWHELEIYRCGDGCQRLALAIADEVHHRKGCRVFTHQGVRQIDLLPPGGGVVVTAQSTRKGTFDDWLREKIPVNPATDVRHYDCVVFAIPPAVWGHVKITPAHPSVIGLMGGGVAVKFFSNVKERFWIKDGFAPMGGSLEIGQVWEGTDNQTRVRGQDIVLSVYTGARAPSEADYKKGLARLYPGYLANLKNRPKPIRADWSKQPFIETGLTAPQLGQIFTTGQRLNEPFHDRLFFAGEHIQMDHFGYMEGAIRSGKRAARLLIDTICGQSEQPPRLALVPPSGVRGGTAAEGDLEFVASRPTPSGRLMLWPRRQVETSSPLPIEPAAYGVPGSNGGPREEPDDRAESGEAEPPAPPPPPHAAPPAPPPAPAPVGVVAAFTAASGDRHLTFDSFYSDDRGTLVAKAAHPRKTFYNRFNHFKAAPHSDATIQVATGQLDLTNPLNSAAVSTVLPQKFDDLGTDDEGVRVHFDECRPYFIFVPAKVREADTKAAPDKKATANVSLFYGVEPEINLFGLCSFFENADDAVLITVPGIELWSGYGKVPWGIGITDDIIRSLFDHVGLQNTTFRVLSIAGYSTGYRGVNLTVINKLVNLSALRRLVYFDAFFHHDDHPRAATGSAHFRNNTRWAVNTAIAASGQTQVVIYGVTTGGTPRQASGNEPRAPLKQMVKDHPGRIAFIDLEFPRDKKPALMDHLERICLARMVQGGIDDYFQEAAVPAAVLDLVKALPARGTFSTFGRAGFTDLYAWVKSAPGKDLLARFSDSQARHLVAKFRLLNGWTDTDTTAPGSPKLRWYEMRHREFVQEIGKEAILP